VRKYLIWASATLALAISSATGCGATPTTGSASPASTCVNSSATHRAYVVVQHGSGTTLQKCVGFSGDTIDGKSLMDKSGIDYQTQTTSYGPAVCAIDSEPKTFDKCFNSNGPNWSLFIETNGSWTVAQTGFADPKVILHDKDALGWRYIPYTENPSPPPLPKAS
jgi:hypothetical protein